MKQPQIETLLSAAKNYWQRGFSLIPCHVDKRPRIAWQAYSQVRPTAEQIQDWFSDKQSQSIGLLLGAVSQNIIAIDLDGIAAIQHFYQQFPTLCESTYSVLSGSYRGLHLYFQVQELPPNLNVRVEHVGGFELRGQGQYVIAPPSPHPSGHRYCVYRDYPILEVQSLADVVDWMQSLRQENRQDLSQIATQIESITVQSNSHKQAYLETVVSQELARVQHAQEGQRNNALFYAALRLANLAAGGELSWSDMRKQLLAAAHRVGTPQAEAEGTINSAWRIGSKRPRSVR
jgi:bifunctional DNA primase/polymerase-like protein